MCSQEQCSTQLTAASAELIEALLTIVQFTIVEAACTDYLTSLQLPAEQLRPDNEEACRASPQILVNTPWAVDVPAIVATVVKGPLQHDKMQLCKELLHTPCRALCHRQARHFGFWLCPQNLCTPCKQHIACIMNAPSAHQGGYVQS